MRWQRRLMGMRELNGGGSSHRLVEDELGNFADGDGLTLWFLLVVSQTNEVIVHTWSRRVKRPSC